MVVLNFQNRSFSKKLGPVSPTVHSFLLADNIYSLFRHVELSFRFIRLIKLYLSYSYQTQHDVSDTVRCNSIIMQGSGIGHVANNYLRPILLLPKKTGFR